MSGAWALVAVPATLALLTGLLMLSAAAERRLLSPTKLIAGVVRGRRSTPEFAEAFVARQIDLLLEQQPGAPKKA
ncbi:MAG TPA: hypothetical protein VFJ85_10300 [Acidimicrobiales bacterium]|nr:hypothetical protein [Acidimicrobiales bacterium]